MKELHLGDTKADLNSLLGLATKFGMKELKTRWSMLLHCVCVFHYYPLSLVLSLMLAHAYAGWKVSFVLCQ